MTCDGSAYALPTPGPVTAGLDSSSLPTPTAPDGRGENITKTNLVSAVRMLPTPRTSDAHGSGVHGQGGMDLRTAVALLPTPVAHDSGNSPEEHLLKKPGRGVVTSLAIIVENDLLLTGGVPTPPPSHPTPDLSDDPHPILR